MKSIIYYDLKIYHSKTAAHAQFDEGINDLETPTPNVKQLKKGLGKTIESETQEISPPESLNLFSQ
eukprot:5877298-Ditylum_brightwellii.AAC.1